MENQVLRCSLSPSQQHLFIDKLVLVSFLLVMRNAHIEQGAFAHCFLLEGPSLYLDRLVIFKVH